MKKKIIVSGIPAGNSGVGRLIQYLINSNDNEFIIKTLGLDFNYFSNNNIFINYLNKIINRIINNIYKFLIKFELKKLKNEKIVLIHPQTVGLSTVINLIENNEVYFYVMDSSFFCIKSYNNKNNEYNPCLACIKKDFEEAKKNGCKPFPIRFNRNYNIKFLKKLMKLKNKIIFLAQNKNQKKLLEKHFGNINCKVVGLKTSEIKYYNQENFISYNNEVTEYDFVYHASPHPAKGLNYVLELSRELTNYSFLIPSSIIDCSRMIKNKITKNDYPNITFKNMRWESGLKEHVMTSKIVLNPSLWSAPIEGALIKSILFNGAVGTFGFPYSFTSEIPNENIIKLDNKSIEESANILRNIINNKNKLNKLKNNSKEWVKEFIENNSNVFEKIKILISNDFN